MSTRVQAVPRAPINHLPHTVRISDAEIGFRADGEDRFEDAGERLFRAEFHNARRMLSDRQKKSKRTKMRDCDQKWRSVADGRRYGCVVLDPPQHFRRKDAWILPPLVATLLRLVFDTAALHHCTRTTRKYFASAPAVVFHVTCGASEKRLDAVTVHVIKFALDNTENFLPMSAGHVSVTV